MHREHFCAKWPTDSRPFPYLLISSSPRRLSVHFCWARLTISSRVLRPVTLVILTLVSRPSQKTVCASSNIKKTNLSFAPDRTFTTLTVCWLVCRRVSAEGRQSSWLTVRPAGQQSWTVLVLPVLTKLPPLNPQGEPWPEGCWRRRPSHGEFRRTRLFLSQCVLWEPTGVPDTVETFSSFPSSSSWVDSMRQNFCPNEASLCFCPYVTDQQPQFRTWWGDMSLDGSGQKTPTKWKKCQKIKKIQWKKSLASSS